MNATDDIVVVILDELHEKLSLLNFPLNVACNKQKLKLSTTRLKKMLQCRIKRTNGGRLGGKSFKHYLDKVPN